MPTDAVAIGFYGHVGVALPSGQTCHGSRVAVLLTTNAKFKETLSMLIDAQTTKQMVKFYALGATSAIFGQHCVITEASLGDFPLWQ